MDVPEFHGKSLKWPLWTPKLSRVLWVPVYCKPNHYLLLKHTSAPYCQALLASDVVEKPYKFTNEQWKAAQRADEVITQVHDYLQKKPETVYRKSLSDEAHGMVRQKDKLVLQSDLLNR